MIAIIVAMAKNRVIGNQGKIPWRIKGEQKLFRELTTGNVVIMGRRTYEEIGHPLPNRQTYLVSSTLKVEEENCRTVSSLQEAIRLAKDQKIYIAGGGKLYQEAIGLADRLYLTLIDREIEGDTYFPEFDRDCYELLWEEHHEGEIPYTYVALEKKKVPEA